MCMHRFVQESTRRRISLCHLLPRSNSLLYVLINTSRRTEPTKIKHHILVSQKNLLQDGASFMLNPNNNGI